MYTWTCTHSMSFIHKHTQNHSHTPGPCDRESGPRERWLPPHESIYIYICLLEHYHMLYTYISIYYNIHIYIIKHSDTCWPIVRTYVIICTHLSTYTSVYYSKETYTSVKRDLHWCQKRPTLVSKEAYALMYLFVRTYLHIHLFITQKRPHTHLFITTLSYVVYIYISILYIYNYIHI